MGRPHLAIPKYEAPWQNIGLEQLSSQRSVNQKLHHK